ncbi:Bzz1p [Sporobolomyces salmoneus]|uniref:Bzz1p n=1 Tax=Sporobolomyces salmoneus TaxID=183962 RepID=UPI00317E5E4B
MSTSYGAALPDSEPLVHSRISSYLSLLPSFSQFLQSLSTESLSHSQKLSSLIGTYRKQTSSTARERGGDDSTLETGLAKVLEQMDLGVREIGMRAEKEGKEVGGMMGVVGSRLDSVRKKHHEHYKRLLSERDRLNDQREKSKSVYYSSCQAVESARQKKQSASSSKDVDKLQRAYDLAVQEMGIAKNQYLLDIDSSNVSKDSLYNRHLPSLHDDYQLLEHSTTLQFIQLVEKMVGIQQESLERLKSSLEVMREGLKGIEPERDQEIFVERESRIRLQAWENPPDAVFEECSVWHETDEFSTTPASITYLQNVQLKASTKLAELNPAFETKKREVGGLRNLREAYEQQPGLGDTLGVIENLFSTQHDTTLLDLSTTEQSSQIELISATLGDSASTGLRPHEFKSSHFVTPSVCVVCEGSVWGKGIKCEKCSMVCHAKCELKVPAGCSARPGSGIVRHKSKKSSNASEAGGPPSASMSSLSLNRSTSSAGSVSTVASSTAPPPRRGVPPPMTTSPSTSTPTAAVTQSAVLLYDYSAASHFELTVSEGDTVQIVEPEDDSGWTKVRTNDGREGLVPGSYLEISSSIPLTRGGSTAAVGAQQAVIALYDYTPVSGAPDELSLIEGERAILVGKGMEAGEGWAEVEIEGKGRGIVPASYIQLV